MSKMAASTETEAALISTQLKLFRCFSQIYSRVFHIVGGRYWNLKSLIQQRYSKLFIAAYLKP